MIRKIKGVLLSNVTIGESRDEVNRRQDVINCTITVMGFAMICAQVRSGAGLEMYRNITPFTKVLQEDPALLVRVGGSQGTTG